MNLAKDAFIVLFCLAGSDGNLDERERAIIIDFLNRQSIALGQMNFAPQQAVSEIAALDLAGRNETLKHALQNLKAHSSPEVQLAMLDVAATIGATDGVITDGERILFQTMAAVWGIDLQEFLRQRGVSVVQMTQQQQQTAAQTGAGDGKSSRTLSARFALAAYRPAAANNSQTIGMNEVMRALVSHRDWLVPLELFAGEGATNREVERMLVLSSERFAPNNELWIFTDDEAAHQAQAKNPFLGVYGGGMSGTELFLKIPSDVKTIRVNEGSQHNYTWFFQRGGGIEGARVWARSIALEDRFAEWERTGAFDEAAFAGFPFITYKHSTAGVLMLPYESLTINRAAVFTTPDSAERFLSRFSEKQRAALTEVTVEGATMLRQLPEIGADGIVVNVVGPGATFVHDFIKKSAANRAAPKEAQPVVSSNNRAPNYQSAGEGASETSAGTLSARAALSAFNRGRIQKSALMRALASHRQWFAPLDVYSYEGKLTRSFEQTLVLSQERLTMGDEVWIFTDEEAARAAAPKRPFLGTFVGGLSGAELFRDIRPSTKTIRINPHSPEGEECSLTLNKSDGGITLIKMWAGTVSREDSYERWQKTGKPDGGDFNSYHEFLVFDHSSGPIITLPNHSGMLNPAAAFTASDCADMFLSKLDEKLRSEMREMRVSGRELLQKRQTLGIDGLIINLYGPGATYALPFDLLDPSSSPANLTKNAFVLLYFLASADGQMDERETQIIFDFLTRQAGALNFDARQTMLELAALSGDDRIKEYNRALDGFKIASNKQDRLSLLRCACDLTAADGSLSEGEKLLFQDMARNLGVDLQKFFAEMGVFVAPPSSAPPVIPGLTFTPDTVGSPPVLQSQTGTATSKKIDQGNFFAWSLGSQLSLYAISAAHLDASLSASYWEKAQMAADAMGLRLAPLTGMTNDLPENYAHVLGYFLKEEGRNLADRMNPPYGSAVSDYFQIIVNSYLLLLMYNPNAEGKALAESALNGISSLRQHTIIPEDYFQPLALAVKTGVSYEALKGVVADLDLRVSEFLYARIEP